MLVPIGRFSKMTRLWVKALRLYDEIGLLLPAHVDSSSGYWYYDLAQANQAEAVRILRSVDTPLHEIRAILETDDPEMARQQLVAHRERMAEHGPDPPPAPDFGVAPGRRHHYAIEQASDQS